MNVLYLSYDGLTDPLGQSQVLPYLIGLSEKGIYHFTIISAEKKERYLSQKQDIQKICETYNIDWHPIIYHKSPPIVSTLYDLWKMVRLAQKLHSIKKIKIIHCRSYLSTLVSIYFLKKVPFIFDMRGFWADERVEGGLWSLKNPVHKIIYKFFKRKERVFLEKAGYTISLTYQAKNEISRWHTFKNNNIQVIPCCVDTILFDQANISFNKQEQLRAQLGISPENYILSYVGSVGTWYLLDEMFSFFKILLEHNNQTKFLFINQYEHELILKKVREFHLPEHTIILCGGKREEMPALIALSQLSIMFIRPTYSKIASSPTKLAELMALGIPVIANTGVGDVEEIIDQYQAGICLEQLNLHSFKNAIRQLQHINFSSENIRKGATEYFSLQRGVDLYEQVYKYFL